MEHDEKVGASMAKPKTRQLNLICACAASSFAVILKAAPAFAVGGNVTGTLQFYQQNGSYCPTSGPNARDCTGTNYPQSEFHQPAPIRHVPVYLYNEDLGVIGQTESDDSGYFNINYGTPWWYWNTGERNYVYYISRQAGLRVFVNYADGGYRWWPSWYIALNGGTYNMGTLYWGSSDAWQNTYWAAEKVWRESLQYIGVFQTNYWVEIRGFTNNDVPGFLSCGGGSCNGCTQHKVLLDTTAGFAPQGRVMHEMGHAASQTAKPWRCPGSALANFDGLPGWSFTRQLWKVNASEEALATFLADSTLYWPNATQPHTCNASQAECSTGSFNLETSDGASGCYVGEHRWPLSGMRMLWDAYDDPNDGYDQGVALGWAWWPLWDVLSHYPNGTGWAQTDEIWNSDYTAVDSPDGRSGVSYDYNLFNDYGGGWGSIQTTMWNNCNP
jgi:hypothetical protein